LGIFQRTPELFKKTKEKNGRYQRGARGDFANFIANLGAFRAL
jgi:hypothetical protein